MGPAPEILAMPAHQAWALCAMAMMAPACAVGAVAVLRGHRRDGFAMLSIGAGLLAVALFFWSAGGRAAPAPAAPVAPGIPAGGGISG